MTKKAHRISDRLAEAMMTGPYKLPRKVDIIGAFDLILTDDRLFGAAAKLSGMFNSDASDLRGVFVEEVSSDMDCWEHCFRNPFYCIEDKVKDVQKHIEKVCVIDLCIEVLASSIISWSC